MDITTSEAARADELPAELQRSLRALALLP
jgi:hypothetical protein